MGEHMSLRSTTSLLAIAATAALSFSAPAVATEGYSAIGFGARSKALAGAGVADSRDATAAALNPAGLVHVGNEIVFSMSAFSPQRSFSTDVPGAVIGIAGEVESDRPWFFIPNMAINTKAFANPLFDSLAFSMVGNGGMNTTYADFANPSCAGFGGGSGLFCGGAAGINLLQMVMSVAMAKQIAPGISVGVAPMFAVQGFEARGIGLFRGFGAPGTSIAADSTNDWGYGFGVRGGIELSPMQNVRIGVAGTSPIYMTDVGNYSGLFAEQGGFDIPPSIHVGLAVDVNPALTFMFDWRHIWFSSIDSVGNPSTNIIGCLGGDPTRCLGGSNGPGFGWKDVDAFKFGVEYRANEKMTLRAGYAYNTQPVQGRDVTFNILAPAVTQHHITGGLAYDLGGGYTLELAGMYAPEVSVTGTELFNDIFAVPFGAPQQNVTVEMHQYEVTVGVKYKFGEDAAPLK